MTEGGGGAGLVCVGDSIITADRSWGYWLARGGGWPLVRHSARGARSWQVLDQLPHLRGHRYAVGALTVGANDVLFDWDAARYEANLLAILEAMSSACDKVLISSFPQAFRRFPGSSPERRRRVMAADQIIAGAVAAVDVVMVDGSDLAGPLLCPDRVHPSVRGHLLLADRAAAALGLAVVPSAFSSQASQARNDHSRSRYLAVTAKTTLRELLTRVTHQGQAT
ncbi:MAG TPA: GDSL-type esterase/lipase family protein [Frankiaceae bacterium]|jgi:hypothetical protein|nr:GDSL-type esterase/lipase family protein [Frankiaceae bacterium]